MTAKVMFCALFAGSALVMFVGARSSTPQAPTPKPRLPVEAPWLTPQAAAQIVAPVGNLGPVFSDLELGGPPPSPATRARIAQFARANRVAIDLDVVDGALAAVRFDVTYPGCCGYEGADALAMRFGRPKTETCCGCATGWLDDWTTTSEDGSVHMRARVRVNRVQVRWERSLALTELISRADALLGQDPENVGRAAPDHWIEVESRRRYLLEIPYEFVRYEGFTGEERAEDRNDLGVHLVADRGRITEARFALRDLENPDETELEAALRARWGRPRVAERTWTWRKSDRIITADFEERRISIAKR